MVIIHVLPHAIDNFLRPGDDHSLTRFIRLVKHYGPEDQHEFWTMSKKIKAETVRLHPDGFVMRTFPCIRVLPLPVEFSFSLLAAVGKKAWKEKETLWHLHSYYLWMNDFLAVLLFFLRRNFVMHHRGGGASFSKKAFLYTLYHYFFALPLTLRMAKKILVQNHGEEKRLQRWYRIPSKKIMYFPNVFSEVPKNIFSRGTGDPSRGNLGTDAARLACGGPACPPAGAAQRVAKSSRKDIFRNFDHRLLYVGRLEKIKGVFYLMDVLPNIINQFPNVMLTFIGKGSEEHELQEKIRNLHVEDHVQLLSWQPESAVISWMQKSDIFLYPNHKKTSEGMPAALVEAQGYGLPAIGFRIEGVEDVIAHGETGFLVGSWEEFEEKIILLLRNSSLRKAMSDAAKKRAQEQFSAEEFYPLLIKMYREC